jgi:uncharacterized protein with beta-barrel porin domain
MRHRVLAEASVSVLIVLTAHAAPAVAEDTQTSSYGERYDSVYINEYGNGSTTYSVNVNADLGGEQVTIAGLSRYFISYDPSEIAEAVPGTYGYMYQGVPVTVEAWSAPEHTDSWYDLIDVFVSDSYSFDIIGVTSIQTTSGDGPDALVPIGNRGFCYDDGVSGATNYDAFDGTFANCEGADDYLVVAPGSINTNVHSTTIYQDTYYHFESIDDAYTDFYTVRPLATTTASSGTMESTVATTTTIRNDTFATRMTGVVGGQALFDATVDGVIGDPGAQSALTALTAPRGQAVGGAPAVIAWSTPVLTGSNAERLSSSAQTTTDIQTYQVVTITQTQGAGVMIGDLGACTSTGTSGATTGASPTGSFATCEGGVAYVAAPDETNTNTHTTFMTETTVNSILTDDWLTTGTYTVTGTPTLIGQIHSAVRDALYEAGSGFARKQGDALMTRRGPGFSVWGDGFTGTAERDSDSVWGGSSYSPDGIAGGISFRMSEIASVGVALSHETGDSDLDQVPELADLTQTQLGVAAELSPGVWRVVMALSRGWAEIDTTRDNGSGGGVARADYDGATWLAAAEAGPEFRVGPVILRPFAGLEWSRATLDEFTEDGEIALSGDDDSASRTAALLGMQIGTFREMTAGKTIRLWADARIRQTIDGKERSREVSFADDPGELLEVRSAAEDGTYAQGRAGASLYTAAGLGFHLGVEGQAGDGENNWRATAGVSGAF